MKLPSTIKFIKDIQADIQADIRENYDDEFKEEKKILSEVYFEEIIKALEEQDNHRWIPVSERLPNERDWYLSVFKESDTGFVLIPRVADYVGKETRITTKDYWMIIDFDEPDEYIRNLECIAWMPLPEPYKQD